ncbi:hypothetical protein COU76_00025 [Candidatus Peregrinibacteria bacterium CG10_big_fil_rev_8_21_14_0_10_49_10]|nr:MAG: hypothetical protein COU76_00025 [Candidatus Peregrinibacteria bacterium CG10_big_fil_rev_8_21_14_0_10_49_10]
MSFVQEIENPVSEVRFPTPIFPPFETFDHVVPFPDTLQLDAFEYEGCMMTLELYATGNDDGEMSERLAEEVF